MADLFYPVVVVVDDDGRDDEDDEEAEGEDADDEGVAEVVIGLGRRTVAVRGPFQSFVLWTTTGTGRFF
jgi:hypothetical protein